MNLKQFVGMALLGVGLFALLSVAPAGATESAPTGPQQLKTDGITEIGEGQTTDESTVVFKADVSSSDGNQVRWQIELREAGEGFLNTYDPMDGGFLQTDLVDAATPTLVEITRSALANGNYHWQYRAYVDATGESLPWMEYEAAGNTDFIVQATQVIKVAVILAEPDGSTFTKTKADFETIAADTEDYWCEVSFGEWDGTDCSGSPVSFSFSVFDNGGQNYTLPKSHQDYGTNNPQTVPTITDGQGIAIDLSDQKDLTSELMWDAINRADDGNTPPGEIDDFSQYDIVAVVFAGQAEQSSSVLLNQSCPQCPRTLMWDVSFAPTFSSNQQAQRWVALSEYDSVGPWAHEVGHAVGSISTISNSVLAHDFGAGERNWTLMSFGAWNGNPKGSRPAHISSYSKEALGWFSSDQFLGLGSHVIESLETADASQPVSKVGLPGDYYLLEARSKRDGYSFWDQGVSGDALVIYKVEHDQATNTDLVVFTTAIGDLVGGPFRDPQKELTIDATDFDFLPDKMLVEATLSDGGFLSFLGASIVPNRNIFRQLKQLNLPEGAPNGTLAQAKDVPLPHDESDITAFGYELDQRRYDRKVNGAVVGGMMFAVWPSGLLILLLLLAKIGRRMLASERKRKILQQLKRGGIIIVVLMYLVILGSVAQQMFEAQQERSGTKNNVQNSAPAVATVQGVPASGEEVVPGDIDLHAYDDLGNHVGMNYVTGLYESQIPGTIASGDRALGEEWIFVPEGTNVTFEVRSDDIEQFFAENPDIEASLSSTEETYTFGAVTYDATSQRYESASVENIVINPGETRIHTIGGTTEAPTVDEGVVVVELDAISDTYLKNGHPNKNFGSEATTWIRGSGKRSTLVQFDQQAIADAVGTGTLISATLELETVDGTAGSWTSNGKLVGTYRLTHPWTELGATWNCGNDIDTSNSSTDCPSETWEMNQNQSFSWEAVASDSNLFTNDSSGTVSWDVISDLSAWLSGTSNYGWIIRKNPDGSSGRVQFYSRETATPSILRIVYDVLN